MSQLKQVAAAARALRMTSVVDYDFPEMMHNLDRALRGFEALPLLPKVVCLCGSTRFKEAFQQANLRETIAGNIVLTVGCMTHSDSELNDIITPEIKVKLDELHKRKIDLADEVLILNVGGYVGESTYSELGYARLTNKTIRWLEEPSNELRRL
ncbi:MAG: hypothetical protein ACREP9_19005 [Candidatus Dormibacteraceae bacterium]